MHITNVLTGVRKFFENEIMPTASVAEQCAYQAQPFLIDITPERIMEILSKNSLAANNQLIDSTGEVNLLAVELMLKTIVATAGGRLVYPGYLVDLIVYKVTLFEGIVIHEGLITTLFNYIRSEQPVVEVAVDTVATTDQAVAAADATGATT